MHPATTANSYAIKTATFEGPLELLVELVEKRKLLINDISLAAVTDEYMQTVSHMQELSLPNTAEFIRLAATLLLIKSKSLLPVLELTEEEEASIDELEEQLRHYQIYREASQEIAQRFNHEPLFEPQFVPPSEPLFLPDRFCALAALTHALADVLERLPKPEARPAARVKPTISLEAMIDRLHKRITQQMRTSFNAIKAGETEHKDVIVGFLAVLELCKQGTIIVRQQQRFADIEIELANATTPEYY